VPLRAQFEALSLSICERAARADIQQVIPPYRCRANMRMAHIRQSRPYSGIGFQVKVFEPFTTLFLLLSICKQAARADIQQVIHIESLDPGAVHRKSHLFGGNAVERTWHI